MLHFTTTAVGFVLGAGVLLAGCESSNHSKGAAASSDANMSDSAMAAGSTTRPSGSSSGDMRMSTGVTCSKCRVTYVRVPYTVPGYEGPRVVGYRTEKSTECPDCRRKAMEYFSSGKWEPECKTCGATMEKVEPQPAQ
jgi:ribosomal protein L37AE/L43A